VDAVTFKRYYHGEVEWMTIPMLAHLPLQQPDDLLDELRRPNAIVPALDKIRGTLQVGPKVWLAPPGAGSRRPTDRRRSSRFALTILGRWVISSGGGAGHANTFCTPTVKISSR
jgi:hypothetical protein